MKRFFILAIVAAAIMAVDAATVFDWRVDLPRNYAHNCSLYQGTTGVFSPHICSNGVEIAGLEFEGLYYQTNGMGNAWWRLDSLTFAPANDCGAAQYRFFIRHVVGADSSIHYDAQGILRMLPSPGFTPNAIAAPVATLDFAELEILNAPWPAEIAAVAQAATNYTAEAVANYKPLQTAKSSPSAASTEAYQFIDTVSQDTNGEITATKKNVSAMGAASSSAAGSAGLVPAPAAGKQNSFLRGDGTWAVPTDTTYTFDGTYNASTNKAATVSSVTSRIQALDATATSSDGTNVQVKVTETDGKITEVNVTKDDTEKAFTINYRASDNALVFSKAFGTVS